MGKAGRTGKDIERVAHDLYPTPAGATRQVISKERELLTPEREIWEPACGHGHITGVLEQETDCDIVSSDLVNYGFGEVEDFLETERQTNIIFTNPPFSLAEEFIRKGLEVADTAIIILARLGFLVSLRRGRGLWVEHPPSRIWVHSGGLPYWKEEHGWKRGGAFDHAWFVWDKTEESESTSLGWLPESIGMDECEFWQ